MLKFLFIFPLLISLILMFFKTKLLNVWSNFIYSLVFLFISIQLYFVPQEWGKYFAVDDLNILFLLVLALVYCGVALYNLYYFRYYNVTSKWHTYKSMFIQLFIFSMTGVILSNNIGMMWVFIEATTLTTAYLIYYERSKAALEAAWKYIFICSIGISLAFVGIIFLSRSTGSLNSLFFVDLYRNAGSFNLFWLKLSIPFILIGLGTKVGLAPVHAWLPDAHSEAPAPISALLSATLLNTAFLGILRVYKIYALTPVLPYAQKIFLIMGFLSLLVSAVFMVRSQNYKRMLAYSSIENMGIIVLGIAIGGIGYYAALLHLTAHSLIKTILFLTSGNIYHSYHTKEITQVNSILYNDKFTGWLWIMGFVGIAGFPPFPVFISEFLLIKAFLSKSYWLLAILFLLLLTIIMFGLGNSVFKMCFGREKLKPAQKFTLLAYLPQLFFMMILIILGVYMPTFFNQILVKAAAII